ncbi:hypothetical protein KZZ52_23835 [Dactylosporangium sp. AC04546]|uniref:hypothetical protein n=1 Tax=Dactylosporangium sp. AC04546 TaxID=2862460 RepID=UPI001EE0E5D6|nr:hypothetical protein [Dactylosporangium sp. AC04546]WVK88309.1 hypothetical protein KZZ52_23835 [Dactylosporangium sp. AC04546]
MGASQWSWQVPYEPDIAAALERARQETYDQGQFYRQPPNEQARSMTEEEFVAADIAYMRASMAEAFGDDVGEIDDAMARASWHAAHVDVRDPDSLLESQPFSRTHSVIDMSPSSISPVPDDELQALFATLRPTPDAVEAAIADRSLTGYVRDHGRYVVTYTDGSPSTIVFVGHSGD